MIIHISSELVREINKAIDKEKILFNEFLEKLFITSLKEGKHIISISKKDIFTLIKYDFLSESNKKNLRTLDYIRNKNFQSLENLINQIEPSDIVIVTYDKFDDVKDKKNNVNFRYIPFFEFMDSETLSRTTIISEHIKNDGVIYENFFPAVYKKYRKLPFNFYLRKEMGGGSSIHSVLQEKCNKDIIGFHIFISDSDKISPLKPGNGTTAKTLFKEYKKCKKDNKKNIFKFKIYILEVRELENLIPLFYLKDYCKSFYENYLILIVKNPEEVIKFIDIKKGVYCNEEIKRYQSVNDCNIDECNNKRKFFCKLLKNNQLDFFYEKKCEKLLEKFQEKFNSSVDELVDIILNKCKYKLIRNNWIEVGRIIYSWGVGVGKQNIL